MTIFLRICFKVVFSEKNPEIDKESVFVFAIMNLMVKPEITQDVRLL
ncbi:MAG: hypothetical protein ACE5RB_01200 [Nitrosopumilus sp.]